MINNYLLVLFLLSFTGTSIAEDAAQLVLDGIDHSEYSKKITDLDEDEIDETAGAFLPGTGEAGAIEVLEDSQKQYFLSQENPEITQPNARDYALERGQKVIGDASIPSDRLLEATDREIFKSIANQKDYTFSFYYIRDEFDVTDSRGVYQQTYIDDQSAMRGGTLMFSWEKAIVNSWVNILWGANFGFGLAQGNGRFIDGERSDTEFSLWSLPIELGLTVELPVSTWFVLSAEAGPSALGLYQVRSDFDNGAAGKRRRQVGTGYYAEARFKLSLSNIFSHTAFNYFSQYGVSNTSLDIIARMQDYGNFQDDISISGQSLGVGFTFDFL
tara:strand:+ start:8106 stop:9092 length:987 start_codon:yes stop_codon:yes gene_type:complete